MSSGTGGGHLGAVRGLRGIGVLSHCVLPALGREGWDRRD